MVAHLQDAGRKESRFSFSVGVKKNHFECRCENNLGLRGVVEQGLNNYLFALKKIVTLFLIVNG